MGGTAAVLSKGSIWRGYLLILVALGTQDFQFDRLLKKIDALVESGVIAEPVTAQTGYSPYKPQHYDYKGFFTFEEFDGLLAQCSMLITHAGTGTLVGALKKGKTVIAVPRQSRYGEHVDDHQKEIVRVFSDSEMVLCVEEMDELESVLAAAKNFCPKPFVSGREKIISLLEDFIQKA